MGGGGGGGACNRTKNVFQSMLNQQCLFKASKCHKKNFISIQARGGLYWEEVGLGTYNQIYFLFTGRWAFIGGGGLIPVNGGGGNNWKFAVTCQRLLHY